MKLNIGIDIDGTINNATECNIINGIKFCKERNIPSNPDITKTDIGDMFGWTKNQRKEFLDIYFPWNVKNCGVNSGATEVIQKLYNLGHKIYIITARDENYNQNYLGTEMVKDTYKWFHKHRIPFHEIIFNCNNIKDQVCEKYNIDLFIDDEPGNIIQISEKGFPVIIYPQPYNKHLKNTQNTYYAKNWIDILAFITNIPL